MEVTAKIIAAKYKKTEPKKISWIKFQAARRWHFAKP